MSFEFELRREQPELFSFWTTKNFILSTWFLVIGRSNEKNTRLKTTNLLIILINILFYSDLTKNPREKENTALGFGEANIFDEQLDRIKWKKQSNGDKLAILKKLYSIIKGKKFSTDSDTQFDQLANQEELESHENESMRPLLNVTDSVFPSTLETRAVPRAWTFIEMNEKKE